MRAWLLITIAIGLAGLVIALSRSKERRAEGANRRSAWDYILLWPLLFDRGRRKSGGSLFSRREAAGWIIVLALMLAAIVFFR